MGTKPRIKGVCPDQTCMLFDKKKEIEAEKSDRAIMREIANELGLGFNTVKSWLFRNKMGAIAPRQIKYPPLPEGKFNLIYADPPWKYEHGVDGRRQIETKYDTIKSEEVPLATDEVGKQIQDVFADDAVLFLWATSPKLEEAIILLNTWGFKYRTCAIWDKHKIGMGYYFRQQHELLLVGVRGKFPVPLPADRISSIISSPRTKHSKKPSVVYEIIENMYPQSQKIELFAREKREGWQAWGDEV